ncbi:putative nuclease HARBI1 [Leptopilina boulardi]|uniref:putative nuclease HARBI1 n=1 Tax=Leptopilina boulardi TaxID=63433 RepID=UPI0021F65C63|nr:putative nuclease HARBI1 [Leptopilina boulardi]
MQIMGKHVLHLSESLKTVADRFGVCKDTAWNCMLSVSQVLNALSGEYIKWPEANNFHQVARDFSNAGGFPNVLAAVDGCHVEIRAPSTNPGSYVNRKGFHSLLLQGMCDSQGRFLDVFAGVCGSVHDNRLFEMSPMGQQLLTASENFCPEEMHILGDAAYKLQPFLMVPFKDNGHLTPSQVRFNTILSKTRMSIERAFGLLKDDMNEEILHEINNHVARIILNDVDEENGVINPPAVQKRTNIMNMLEQERIDNP